MGDENPYDYSRAEGCTGRAVLTGLLVVLLCVLAGFGIGELIWLFLRVLSAR